MKKFFHSIATIITIALALLLGVVVLSIYIDPVQFYLFAFVGYIFPVVWIANIITLIYWILKRKKQVLIPLLAVVIGWTQWHNTFQWSGKTVDDISTLSRPLTVMSLNVKMFDYYQWSGRADLQEKIFDYIRKKNPDIVCLQEFYSTNQKREFSKNYIIARLNNYSYRHIDYIQKKSSGRGFGLATFSKYPIIGRQVLKFGNSTNFSIQSDIKVKGVTVRLFNNHLVSMRLSSQDISVIGKMKSVDGLENEKGIKTVAKKIGRAFKERAMQAKMISRHIENSAYPVIVCGDFNDTPVSYVYHKMRGDLKDAFVESGKGFGGTYNGKLPSFRIDYILFDPKFEAYNFERDKLNLSDHFPIITTINLDIESKDKVKD